MRLRRTHGSAQILWNVPLTMEIAQEDAQHPAAIPDTRLGEPWTRVRDEPAQDDWRYGGRLNQLEPSEVGPKRSKMKPVVLNRGVA